jgi:hypothetical protein
VKWRVLIRPRAEADLRDARKVRGSGYGIRDTGCGLRPIAAYAPEGMQVRGFRAGVRFDNRRGEIRLAKFRTANRWFAVWTLLTWRDLVKSVEFLCHPGCCEPSRHVPVLERSQNQPLATPEELLPSERRSGTSSPSNRSFSNESFHQVIFLEGLFTETFDVKTSGRLRIDERSFITVAFADGNAF